jgi:hypothetical protein
MEMIRYFFTGLVLFASASIACAQSSPPVPDKPVDVNAPPAGTGAMLPRKGVSGSAAVVSAAIVVGWNNMHAYSCQTWKSSSAAYTVKAYSLSSEGVSITATGPTGSPFQTMMAAQCATGNWLSFYVTKKTGTTFTWSNLQTWSYK